MFSDIREEDKVTAFVNLLMRLKPDVVTIKSLVRILKTHSAWENAPVIDESVKVEVTQ